MRVRVRLFAGLREAVGAPRLHVELPEGATVQDLVDVLAREHPRVGAYRGSLMLALDGRFVPASTPLREGAEASLMPPVSGGDGCLHEGPLSLDALLARLDASGAGAVATFLGAVRGGGGVERLRFEAHEEMAEAELAAIRDEAVRKFNLVGCIVRHRLGELRMGEPIVAVLAAAAHRREAFEACAWVMDEVKARVPIWKQEVGPGLARWVNDPTTTTEARR